MGHSAELILRKLLRTGQSALPWLLPAKQEFYYRFRRFTARPHEGDFQALALFDARAPGVYVDIGANHGQSIESIKLFRPASAIVAFEPNTYLADKLKRRYEKDRNLSIRSVGLGDAIGEFTLHVPSYRGFVYDGLASLDPDRAMNWINSNRVYFFDAKKIQSRQIRCSVSTLDRECLEPTFIKIDVQGFEYNVLKGGVETIKRCDPIIFLENYRGDERSVALMERLGYEEYYYYAGRIVPGRSTTGQSFLVSSRRARAEGFETS